MPKIDREIENSIELTEDGKALARDLVNMVAGHLGKPVELVEVIGVIVPDEEAIKKIAFSIYFNRFGASTESGELDE